MHNYLSFQKQHSILSGMHGDPLVEHQAHFRPELVAPLLRASITSGLSISQFLNFFICGIYFKGKYPVDPEVFYNVMFFYIKIFKPLCLFLHFN